MKVAGRDAGKKCVVVDTEGKNYVVIDGETRRRKCNIVHLEPLDKIIEIERGAGHSDISIAFAKLNLKVLETKPRKNTVRPRIKRKTPEQLRAQKEEKKKQRTLLKKKIEEKHPVTELEKKIEAIKEVKSDVTEDKPEEKKENLT